MILASGCVITVPSADIEETKISYDSRDTSILQIMPTTDWTAWEDYFSDTPSACTFTTCSIRASDCVNSIYVSDVSMDSSSPWAVYIDRSVSSGFSVDVCIFCETSSAITA